MPDRFLEAVIVGGGPAGLAAGIHLSRAGCAALLVERRSLGGQALGLERVENYPGFPRGVSGAALMRLWLEQARRWKLETRVGEAVSISRGADRMFSVRLKKGGALRARSVLWCGGADFRRLGVPGEKRLWGRGVWNTPAEAPSCAGLEVAVAGSGEAAVQQSGLFARRARRVYLISRTDRLKAHRLLLRRLSRSGAVRMPGFRVSRLLGENRLEAVELMPERGRGEAKILKADALFVLAGKEPRRAPVAWRRAPPGFFEAGDAAAGIFRQVAVAGGDGMRAAMRCMRYLEGAGRI